MSRTLPTLAALEGDARGSISLEALMDQAPVHLALFDSRGKIVRVSRTFANLLAYEPSDMAGRHFYDFMHEEDAAAARTAVGKLLRGDVVQYTVERRYLHKDGSVVWLMAAVAAVYDPAHPSDQFHVVQFTPIDKQKQAEAESRRANNRWDFAFESARQGVWDFDAIEKTGYCSKAWFEMRGLEERNVDRLSEGEWFANIHPDDIEKVINGFRKPRSGALADVDIEFRERHRDGHYVWILTRGRWVEFTEDGRPKRIIGTDTDITHIKESEAALKRLTDSELRSRIALESAQQGVWDHNIGDNSWYFSVAWKRMRGLADDAEINGADGDWVEQVHPDDRERVREYLARQNSGELVDIAYDYRERHQDGHWIWILARGRVIEWDSDGKPSRIIGTDTDVTEIKESEAALRRMADSEMRWRIALESADQGLWDHNFQTGEKFFSDGWRRLRGIDVDERPEFTLEDWLDTIHPDDREHVRAHNKMREDGVTDAVSFAYRQQKPDGEWMWILSRGKTVSFDADGKPIRVIGTDTDITQVKQSEIELFAMHQRLELALSTSKVGVWEIDLETQANYWDARTREIFGIPDDVTDIPSDAWERSLHPGDRDYAMEAFRNGLRNRSFFSFDYRILVDGEVRHVRCQARYYDDGAERSRMIGVNWDVTEDYERAEELRRANALAEQRNRQLEAARARMEHNSLHDALTGLPNRRWLDTALDGLGSDRRKKRPALLHIDLDRFKQINDTLGHIAGDAMLKHMAQVLSAAVRETDTVARIGGDEFVILLNPAPSRRALEDLVSRLLTEARRPMMHQGQECRSGISIGVAVGSANEEPRQLLVNADIALYRAKNDGRNRAVFFTDTLQAEIVATKQRADEILQGLERGEFVAYYQPQICAGSLEFAGAEALVRWNHPTRGVLGPHEFLKIAEDLDVVSEIDHLILEQALRDQQDWNRNGLGLPKISVNVSTRRLKDEKLIERLKKLNFKPGTLSFELLESIFLDEQDDMTAWNVDRIKDLGIHIDIDDFGTGHASIVSLLKLSPHRFKIDRQLTAPLVQSEQQRRLVRSIIEIGRSQNIEVCAEGVETQAHVDILTDLGCNILQGYHFARPMPAPELGAFLKGQSWRRAG